MTPTTRGASLLNQVYDDLDLRNGRLLSPAVRPRPGRAPGEWESVGDWLILAERMGAERVFFVGDDPVVLFAAMPDGATDADVLAAYRSAWSLSRPHCLFLATGDELRVYALAGPPPETGEPTDTLEPVQIVRRAADVADALAAFHRERLETGELFEHPSFRDQSGRADAQLLHDVRAATEMLVEDGLDAAIAHALVERVILIRYLEDREAITDSYFLDVAGRRKNWRKLLTGGSSNDVVTESGLTRCLASKELTYAVFEKLARDFNGDLFVPVHDERARVGEAQLTLLRRLLTGAGVDPQERLFLWAYDFSVVPTSLISSMYEQFYRSATADNGGTHYTPPELVEYVLADTLTDEVLAEQPRVLDPACGSGIFLVEAFRRIVRYEMARRRRPLSPTDLRELLLTRVAGIDINPEAIRLAAFSLYLAFLNYQSPQDIQQADPLPRLIHDPREGAVQDAVLVIADAFASTRSEVEDEDGTAAAPLPWGSNSFDVIVGNPPWDEPKGDVTRSGDAWTRRQGLPVGDRNPSQQFLWRALSLLAAEGRAALLVSAMPFHNHRHKSSEFRRALLDAITLEAVTDFSAARRLFFDDGAAPFMLIRFRHAMTGRPPTNAQFRSIRASRGLAASRSMVYARVERRWVSQGSLRERDYLWKTYVWGNHHDDALMSRLDVEDVLAEYLPDAPNAGYGYQRGGEQSPSTLLKKLPSLARLDPWGPFDPSWFEDPPTAVKRQPDERRYSGQRILVSQGVRSGFGPNARLVDQPMSFRHIFLCLPLHGLPQWQAKVILGVILSSLGRYRLFMTSGSWGFWHDKFTSGDFLKLPMRLGQYRSETTREIRKAVDDLARVGVSDPEIGLDDAARRGELLVDSVLRRLDAAVYDLFDLSSAERELIDDFRDFTLPLVGREKSWLDLPGVELGSAPEAGTASEVEKSHPLAAYLSTFLALWNRELSGAGQLRWQLTTSARSPMLAAVFETVGDDDALFDVATTGDDDWQQLLDRLSSSLQVPVVPRFASDGIVRAVSDTAIVVIKRSDRRLWTASAAREDFDATLVQAMALRTA